MIVSQASKEVFKTVGAWCLFVMLPIIGGGYLLGEPIGNFVVEHSIVYCSLLWIALSLLWGMIEARYFFYQNSSSSNDNYNPHSQFFVLRSVVLILIWVIVKDGLSILCLIAMFTFFHNGMYYVTRNKIDQAYPHGWFDQSTTSTSWMDVKHLTGPLMRTIAMIAGLIGLILINYQY